MKKLYMAPAIEMVRLETESQMMAISGEQGSVSTGKDPVGNETPGLSHEHRGTWGNLWE